MAAKVIKDLMIGEKIEGVYLFSLNEGELKLKDKTGEMEGELSFSPNNDLGCLSGGAVWASFIVKPGKNGNKKISIKEIRKAERSEYKSSDLFDGLSSEVKERYILSIKQNLKHIKEKSPELWGLICSLYNENTFEMLARFPATVSSVGKFQGGALAVTANVLELVKNMGVTYVRLANGIYADNIDWAIVLTAAAVMELAVQDAYTCEEPFTKKASCIERGYGSLLQTRIDRAISQTTPNLNEETYSKLLNILWCVVEQHAQISPTSKEGVLLQMAYTTYRRLDNFDLFKADGSFGESGYSYSTENRMYVNGKEVVVSSETNAS